METSRGMEAGQTTECKRNVKVIQILFSHPLITSAFEQYTLYNTGLVLRCGYTPGLRGTTGLCHDTRTSFFPLLTRSE
jgi:hypothetical protein